MKKNEFERKFLCYKLPDFLSFVNVSLITQYYLPDGRRFRVVSDAITKAVKDYQFIKKVRKDKGFNTEVIFNVDIKKSREILKECLKNKYLNITKERYLHITTQGLLFEFDVFKKLNNLTVLEVETKNFGDEIIIDKMIQDYIICEVTDKEEFSNINLARL